MKQHLRLQRPKALKPIRMRTHLDYGDGYGWCGADGRHCRLTKKFRFVNCPDCRVLSELEERPTA